MRGTCPPGPRHSPGQVLPPAGEAQSQDTLPGPLQRGHRLPATVLAHDIGTAHLCPNFTACGTPSVWPRPARPPCPAVLDPPHSETPTGNLAGAESRQKGSRQRGAPSRSPLVPHRPREGSRRKITSYSPTERCPRNCCQDSGRGRPARSLPPSTGLPEERPPPPPFSLKERFSPLLLPLAVTCSF